jgi:tetratricopeptide (TPR) repeat protein
VKPQLPAPVNWQDFEDLCFDLWREIWRDPNTQKHGRLGQPQAGVDIFGRPNRSKKWAGVQCKGKDNYTAKRLTARELREEVKKAKRFRPALSEYAIATTAPRDAKTQELARQITEEHQMQRLFSVNVYGWEDIVDRLLSFPQLYGTYCKRLGVPTDPLIAPSRLPHTGDLLFGRGEQLKQLDEAWEDPSKHIISLVAWGGVGKTALVKHWLGRMSADNYRGAERVFDWSFYSQGTSDKAASADQFIDAALRFFEDPDPTQGDPFQKGERLGGLVASFKSLLVLDGLEPLQYPLGPMDGQIKDPALRTLINYLAAKNPGLCLITTRREISGIGHLKNTTAPRIELLHLSSEAGAELLAGLGVKGTDEERQTASRGFDGHPLALTLLGTYLAEVYDGDVSRWRDVPLLTDDQKQGRHARRVLKSYEKWMLGNPSWWKKLRKGLSRTGLMGYEPTLGEQAWSVLRLMGYFARPAKETEINALLCKPPINGLTDSVADLDWESCQRILAKLRRLHLLNDIKRTIPIDIDPEGIDAHPLVREYLTEDLRNRFPSAWKEGNRRLYEHLRGTREDRPKTPWEMTKYYQAIAHAGFAEQQRDAFNDVYMPCIRQRRDTAYNTDSLRAFGDDYGALTSFLEYPLQVVSKLDEHSSFILGEIGFDLRALGRLDEAIEAMKAALKADEKKRDFVNAPAQAAILSHTYLIRGLIREAITFADKGVELAAEKRFLRMLNIANRADARHHAGEIDQALQDFAEAERLSFALFDTPLRSLLGCRYCDCLLSTGRHADVLRRTEATLRWDQYGGYALDKLSTEEWQNLCHDLQVRGTVLPLALNHLVRCRALLQEFESGGAESTLRAAKVELEQSSQGLLKAEARHELPRGLLINAELLRLDKNFDAARRKLWETLSIVVDGKMKLYEADVHLQFAWLALSEKNPTGAAESLGKLRWLVKEFDYRRLIPAANEIESRLANLVANLSG